MQSLFLTIANENSTEEDPTKALSKYNVKVKTAGLVETPVFADYVDILHKTNTIQKQVTVEKVHDTSYDGNANHHNGS